MADLYSAGDYKVELTFHNKDVEASKYTIDLKFSVVVESPVLASKVTNASIEIANSATNIEIATTDVTLYSDAQAESAITVSTPVASITALTPTGANASLVSVAISDGKAVVTRQGEAPEEDQNVTFTLTGLDKWGAEFTTEQATLKISEK